MSSSIAKLYFGGSIYFLSQRGICNIAWISSESRNPVATEAD